MRSNFALRGGPPRRARTPRTPSTNEFGIDAARSQETPVQHGTYSNRLRRTVGLQGKSTERR